MRWVALTLVCLTLVACGGSGDDDDDQPVATPASTATAASASTAPAEATPAGSVGITFLMVSGAAPGERASVTIRTDPVGVECAILYTTPNGTLSDAEGLEPATTRGSGTVSWEWTIGTNTEPGTGRVKVTCGDSSATSDIEISG